MLTRRERNRRRRTRGLGFEGLEGRLVLDGLSLSDYTAVSPAWFAQVAGASLGRDAREVGTLSAAIGAASGAADPAGDVDQWIIRLTSHATAQAGSVLGVEPLLDTPAADFEVLGGLGLPGQVLARSSASAAEATAALQANPNVASFQADGWVQAQVLPDDPDFPSLTGLHNVGQFDATPDADIDAPEA